MTIDQVTTFFDAHDVTYRRTSDTSVAARFPGPLEGITLEVSVEGPYLHLVGRTGAIYEAADTPRMIEIVNSASEARHASQVFLPTDDRGDRVIVYEQRLGLGVAPTQVVGCLISDFLVGYVAHAQLVEQLHHAEVGAPDVIADLEALLDDQDRAHTDE